MPRGESKLRRTRLKPVNRGRKAALYVRNFKGPWPGYNHAEFIRALPCLVCRAAGPSDPHHTRVRGMGGAGGDWRDLAPVCRLDHAEIEQLGQKRFERVYKVDLVGGAKSLADYADAVNRFMPREKENAR